MSRIQGDAGIREEAGLAGGGGDEMNSTSDGLGLRFCQGSPLEQPCKHRICQFVGPGDRAETMGACGKRTPF